MPIGFFCCETSSEIRGVSDDWDLFVLIGNFIYWRRNSIEDRGRHAVIVLGQKRVEEVQVSRQIPWCHQVLGEFERVSKGSKNF